MEPGTQRPETIPERVREAIRWYVGTWALTESAFPEFYLVGVVAVGVMGEGLRDSYVAGLVASGFHLARPALELMGWSPSPSTAAEAVSTAEGLELPWLLLVVLPSARRAGWPPAWGGHTRQDAVSGRGALKAWPRARPRVPGEAADVVKGETVPAYAWHAP